MYNIVLAIDIDIAIRTHDLEHRAVGIGHDAFVARFPVDVEDGMGRIVADEVFGDATIDVGKAFLAIYINSSRLSESKSPNLDADFGGELGEECELR